MSKLNWIPLADEKIEWVFSDHSKSDMVRGCIGHLRGDFGRNGTDFWTSWFEHQPQYKTRAFCDELQCVVNDLRADGALLRNFSCMSKLCRSGKDITSCCYTSAYAFFAESDDYEYCLRCTPVRGDYNFYLYCYDKHHRVTPEQADAIIAIHE